MGPGDIACATANESIGFRIEKGNQQYVKLIQVITLNKTKLMNPPNRGHWNRRIWGVACKALAWLGILLPLK